MKWMELRNYLAPTFMKEIDTVSEQYMSNKNLLIFCFINRFDKRNPGNK